MPVGKPQPWYPGINRSDALSHGLIRAIPMWEGAGQSVSDLLFVDRDKSTTSWLGSPTGYALNFEDTEHIEIGNRDGSPLTGFGAFALSVFFKKIGAFTTTDFIIDTAVAADSIRFINDNRIRFRAGNTVDIFFTGNEWPVDEWHLLTLTRSSDGVISIYRDTNLLGTGTLTDVFDIQWIHTDAAGDSMPMHCGLFMFWDRHLSAADVYRLGSDPFLLFRSNLAQRIAILSAGVSVVADTITKIVGPGGLAGGHRLAGDGGGVAA